MYVFFYFLYRFILICGILRRRELYTYKYECGMAVVALAIALDLGPIGGGILFVVVLFIGMGIKGAIDNTACPKCGKKLAMKEISRKTVSSYATTVDVERKVKNNKGEVIRTYTEAVPATHYTYDCIDECKFCGHRQEVRREATYRD